MQALPEHPQQTPRIRTHPILPDTGRLFKPSPPSARSLAAALLLLAFQTLGLPLQAQAPASPLPASPLPVTRGLDGWLFLSSELRFLKAPTFWGAAAKTVSRSPNPDHADPLVAIEDFHKQLSAMGIHLLLMPVPAKARIYSNALPPLDSSLPAPDPLRLLFSTTGFPPHFLRRPAPRTRPGCQPEAGHLLQNRLPLVRNRLRSRRTGGRKTIAAIPPLGFRESSRQQIQ